MAARHIVLIEDDRHVARFVVATLRLEGFSVFHATTGTAGLTAVTERQPALVVLDLMLPEMDGMEVLRRLKASALTRAIPVIIFTASAVGAEEQEARELGAAAYLRKPIAAADLVAAIRVALGEQPGHPTQ